ncbi:hypothetical protein [Haliangium sp.]|uniref:hypothetical protein n=1 Tax=Haliangium sp. TaxID=2663208 RepID=UPI003D13475E
MTNVNQVRVNPGTRVLVLWNQGEPAAHAAVTPEPGDTGAEAAAPAPSRSEVNAGAPEPSGGEVNAGASESSAEQADTGGPAPSAGGAVTLGSSTTGVGASAVAPREPAAVRAMVDALRGIGLTAAAIDIEDDIERIAAAVLVERPALVINLVDGIYGDTTQQSAVAAYLELLDLPFAGSEHRCLAICQDRVRAHLVLADAGVPVPRFCSVRDLNAIPDVSDLAAPMIVTQAFDDVYEEEGIERPLYDPDEVVERIAQLTTEYELPFMIEEYIGERRIHALVIGHRSLEVLPLIEANPALYEERPEHESDGPPPPWVLAQLDYETADRVRELARRSFRALGCRDLAQIDFHLDEDEQAWVVDVRPMPDLSPDGALYAAAESSERGFVGVIAEFVRLVRVRAGLGDGGSEPGFADVGASPSLPTAVFPTVEVADDSTAEDVAEADEDVEADEEEEEADEEEEEEEAEADEEEADEEEADEEEEEEEADEEEADEEEVEADD